MMVKFVCNSFCTASVKRSHDCTVSGNSGVGGAGEDIADDHSHRNQSDSPARSSAEVVSPSTSIISAKKKMVSSSLFSSYNHCQYIYIYFSKYWCEFFSHEFLETNWTKDSINEDV